MKGFVGSSSSLSLSAPLLHVVVAIAFAWMVPAMPTTLAFAPSSSSTSRSLAAVTPRKRRTPSGSGDSDSALASRPRGEDLEDRLWSIRQSWKAAESCVPSDEKNTSDDDNFNFKEFKDRFLKLPPEPEDQFIMTGDIAILFLYAFTSHSINDSVVKGLLDDPKMTIPEAVRELDPMHEILNMQTPVWVDLASNPNVPFGNPSVDHALEVSAREAFLNHWGPLLSTEGSACVALCTCWLIAGWFHKAFLFDNSTYCSPDQALKKTFETWVTSAVLLACLATGTDWLVGHVPALQSLFCVTCKSAANAGGGMGEFKAAMAATTTLPLFSVSFLSLTQSDVLFIVDSLTVLVFWRWSAHRVLNTFR